MSDTHYLSSSAPATFVGATVTAIVYTTITTTGDIAASATGSGIELTGNVLGYGTDLLVGPLAGNTVRTMARSYSAIARPAITATSRFSALGISFLAGSGAAITTNAIWYGGEKIGSYLYSYYKDYKQKIIDNLQSSTPVIGDVRLIEDNGENILLIEDAPTIDS
jgi:hypothetical protein